MRNPKPCRDPRISAASAAATAKFTAVFNSVKISR